jgi:hypothetical protein
VLPDVTLVEPGRGTLSGQHLIVHSGRIWAEGPADELAGYGGAYVVPGLVDLHSHLPGANPLRTTGAFLLLQLAHGITTVRDAGDIDGTAVPGARALMAAGHPGPRISAAGPFITAGPPRWPNSHRVTGPADARIAVARLADAGSHWVKSYENLDVATIRAVLDEASRRGLGVLGHVPTQLRHEEARLPDSQHFFGVPRPADLSADTVLCRASDWHAVDDRRIDEVVAASVEHRLAHTPTLVTGHCLLAYRDPAESRSLGVDLLPPLYPRVLWDRGRGLPAYRGIDGARLDKVEAALAVKLRLVARLHEAGVSLRLGTDTQQPFVVAGRALHHEMQLFGRAGLPAEEVWRLATTEAAAVVGPPLGEPALGTLKPLAPADFLVYDRDPTRTLDPGRGLLAVVSGGALYRADDLNRAIARQSVHFRHPVRRALGIAGARRSLAALP